jgi:hypothetical protein
MSKLPNFRRIYEQDYPTEYQGLVRTLSVSLNYGIEVLYDLLNGKLTFRDNIASTIKELDVQVDANGKPLTSTIIKKSTADRIEGLFVIKADNLSNSSVYPSSGVFINYTETDQQIIINHITGLQANSLYKVKVLAIR